MRIVAIIIVLALLAQHSNAQEPNTETSFEGSVYKRMYSISISDFQRIELIENLDGTFSGTLTNIVWKVNKKEERIKKFQQRLKIPSTHVEEIMNIGFLNNIETLANCQDVEGCVVGLDGTSISFNIKTPNQERSYWYWEPESNYYQDSTLVEIKNVRTILNGIKKRINLRYIFDSYTNELPTGMYAYGGIVMTKR